MKVHDYDFSGWATKNDLLCSDGRTIRANAFADQDGKKVPLVWNHDHNSPNSVCGHVILENRPEGVYAYAYCNDSEAGDTARELVRHGDISSFSIYANKLKQAGKDVLHGAIKEVSLVFSGANPGARIDVPIVAHGEDVPETEAIIFTGEEIMKGYEIDEELEHAEDDEKTVQDVIDSMTEEQKKVLYFLVGNAVAESEEDDDEAEHSDEYEDEDVVEHSEDFIDEGETEDMKYNVFDNETEHEGTVLTHSDMEAILKDAKSKGSLKEAFLAHAGDDGDVVYSTNKQNYGVNDPSFLFPEAKSLNNPPAWISRPMGWVDVVMNGVSKSPFSRIKSVFADITEDEARAKGYIKGKVKKDEVFSLLKRSTTPQTIYKKQKLDRDDVIDITDFDVVAWIRAEMRVMLNEEIARSILLGDGRQSSDDDKIQEDHIRPIWKDADLFTIKSTISEGATPAATASELIDEAVRARKTYEGSGSPICFTTEDILTEMLLLKDLNGHRIYKSEAEIASAMRVSRIVTVAPMENKTVYKNAEGAYVGAIIVNLNDYKVGADKGGQVSMFDDFDIDYNAQKYLIETRCSGALVKPHSAIALMIKPSTEAQG